MREAQKAAAGRVDELQTHLKGMFLDRSIDARIAKLSQQSFAGNLAGQYRVLSIAIDGMDQAKFKIPRNTENTKDLEHCWRPVLHVTGALVEGLGEFYFLSESDQKKNSDANVNVLGRVLDNVNAVYKAKGQDMPENLVLLTDNTTREEKNQHTAKFLASLIASRKFDCIDNNYFMKGHTHNKLDQRFSVCATALSKAPILQTPEHFAHHIVQSVRYGRLLTETEVMRGAWDWQEFLKPLNIKLSGLTPTEWSPDACHCWRFVRRETLHEHVPEGTELTVPKDFENDEESPNDAILLLKQWIHSDTLAQPPLLVLPAARLSSLKLQDRTLQWSSTLTVFVAVATSV